MTKKTKTTKTKALADPAIFKKIIDAAARNLKHVQAAYRIVANDGTVYEYNVDRVIPRKSGGKKKKEAKYPTNLLRDIFMPHVVEMNVGDLCSIPVPEDIDMETLRIRACAFANLAWGAGNYKSHVNRSSRTVEMFRHG